MASPARPSSNESRSTIVSVFQDPTVLVASEKTSSPDGVIAAPQDLEAATPLPGSTQAQSPSPPTPQDFGPKTPLTPIRRFLVFLGITVTLFLAALDQTIVTTTLPSIAKDFNNFSDISWVGTAYLLTTTAVQPLYGVAADLAGRKRAMYVFFVFFGYEFNQLSCVCCVCAYRLNLLFPFGPFSSL
ncbi:MAG: hypothetical protein J3R72DRAFT_442738 [Linnemannia gamsii]|nr:MAG: hypothetical protein J3R72DRAFT_442738 [Linnemannia gamsii]